MESPARKSVVAMAAVVIGVCAFLGGREFFRSRQSPEDRRLDQIASNYGKDGEDVKRLYRLWRSAEKEGADWPAEKFNEFLAFTSHPNTSVRMDAYSGLSAFRETKYEEQARDAVAKSKNDPDKRVQMAYISFAKDFDLPGWREEARQGLSSPDEIYRERCKLLLDQDKGS